MYFLCISRHCIGFYFIFPGRNKLGSIYVKSSGNGEPNGDHCGADGTVQTIFNIAVAAASRDHTTPLFSEQCAAIMTSVYTQHTATYTRGQKDRDIITLGVNSKCVETNGGSSTATAIASGKSELMEFGGNHLFAKILSFL